METYIGMILLELVMFDPVFITGPDPWVYIVGVFVSAAIYGLVRRSKRLKRYAEYDVIAQRNGFRAVDPVSIRVWHIVVAHAVRSYVRDPVRVDLFYERSKSRPLAERIGLRPATESYAVSFPVRSGFPEVSFTRKRSWTYLGTDRAFAERFPHLKGWDVMTADVQGVLGVLTQRSAEAIAGLPRHVLHVWIREDRVFFILRAPDFDQFLLVLPTIEAAMDAFA